MEFHLRKRQERTTPANLSDWRERQRILMHHAGIFPHAAQEFAEKYLEKIKIKSVKNHSR